MSINIAFKRIYIFFLILSLIILTGIAEASVNKALDIVLLIDKSGSMSQKLDANTPSDKDGVRLEAAKLFGYLCSGEDRISVIEFSTEAKEVYPLSNIQNLNKNNDEFSSAINKINDKINNSHTRIDLALEEAYKTLQKSNSERIPIIILLTDGKFDKESDLPNDRKLGNTFEERKNNVKNKIDNYVNKCKNSNIRIYTIGLGKNCDETFLKEIISQKTNAFFLPAESGNLMEIYQKIFIDITSRFILVAKGNVADQIKKLFVSSFESELVTILLNQDYKIGGEIKADCQFVPSIPEAKKEPVIKTSKKIDLFWFYKLIEPGSGVLNISFDFSKFVNYQLWIIRKLAIDINVQRPIKREFFEQEKIDFQLQVLFHDAAKKIDFIKQIKVKLNIEGPFGSKDIQLVPAGNGGEYYGSYTPEVAGDYKFTFVTTYEEPNSKSNYINSKFMDIRIKPKERFMINVRRTAQQNCTLGSSAPISFYITKQGSTVPLSKLELDNYKVSVSSYVEIEKKQKPPLEFKFNQNEYQANFQFDEVGRYLLKIILNSPNAICRDFEHEFLVSEKPSIIFETLTDERIMTPSETFISARIVFSKKEEPRPAEIYSELFFNENDPEFLVLKKSKNKADSYSVSRSFGEGNYQLKTWFNYLNETIENSIDFYVYNVEKPGIDLQYVNSQTDQRPVIMTVKPMPDSSPRNSGAVISGYIQRPGGETETVLLTKSNDGLSYEGQLIPYSLGAYNFIAEAYYPDINVPEGLNRLYTSNIETIKYEILEINGVKEKIYSDGNILFDISVIQNVSGCGETGQLPVKINCYKSNCALTVSAAENEVFKIFPSYPGGAQFYSLNEGINDIYLSYKIDVTANETPVNQLVSFSFYDEQNSNPSTETIGLTGIGYINAGIINQIFPYLTGLFLIILFIYRKISLNKQRFNFDVQVIGKMRAQKIDHEDLNDGMSPFFINIFSWKKSLKLQYNKEADNDDGGSDEDTLTFGGQPDFFIYCDDDNENEWAVKLSDELCDIFESGPNFYTIDDPNSSDKNAIRADEEISIKNGLTITLSSNFNTIVLKFNETQRPNDMVEFPKMGSDNELED